MTRTTQSRFGMFLAGGLFATIGFLLGQSPSPMALAQVEGEAKVDAGGMSGAIGVSIPNGGAALVKGKDGFAYIVDTRGVFVRAAQSGKGLQLP